MDLFIAKKMIKFPHPELYNYFQESSQKIEETSLIKFESAIRKKCSTINLCKIQKIWKQDRLFYTRKPRNIVL